MHDGLMTDRADSVRHHWAYVRMFVAVLISLTLHAMVLLLQFGEYVEGLPGWAMPSTERRAKSPEIHLRLATPPDPVFPVSPVAPLIPAATHAAVHVVSTPATVNGFRLYSYEPPVQSVNPPARVKSHVPGTKLMTSTVASKLVVEYADQPSSEAEKVIPELPIVTEHIPEEVKQPDDIQTEEKLLAEKQAAEKQAADKQIADRQVAETQAPEKKIAEKQAAEKQELQRREQLRQQQILQAQQQEELQRLQEKQRLAEQLEHEKAQQAILAAKTAFEQEQRKLQEAVRQDQLQKAQRELAERTRLEQEQKIRQQQENQRRELERQREAAAIEQAQAREDERARHASELAGAVKPNLDKLLAGRSFDFDTEGAALKSSYSANLPTPVPAAATNVRRSVFGSKHSDVGLALYIQAWRQKVERNGRLNYAQSSREHMYTDPIVTVSIRSDGSVENVTILRSSGRAEMDEAIRRIALVNAPYSAFPPSLARNYDVIEIRQVWLFDESLHVRDEMR